MTVTIREGSYYETADGTIEGPMSKKNSNECWTSENPKKFYCHSFGQIWEDDGSVAAPSPGEEGHVLVREVAAPGFTIEEGKTYAMRNGLLVGPMIAAGCDFWAKNSPNPIAKNGVELLNTRQCWNASGAVLYQTKHEEGQVIVREHVGDVQTLKIELDAKVAQDIVDAARDEFEKSAEVLLKQIADKDEEIAAAKDAFNISRDEVKLKDARIRDLEYEVRNKDIETVRLNNLSVKRKDLNDALRKQNERIMRENWKMGESLYLARKEIDELQGELDSARACNETLRYDNRQLFQTVLKVSAWKDRGDERLRAARRRLKGANTANVELAAKYNHMIRTGGFFAKAAEYGMGAVLLALVFSAGYAIPALFL